MLQEYRNFYNPSWHKALHGEVFASSVVVVSDIHIKGLDDIKTATLLNLLKVLSESKVQCFILLGDIFDFCLGSNPYFLKKYALIGEALSKLAQAGTRVIFFEGNHEFNISACAWEGVEFIKEGTFILEQERENPLLLAHGDLVYSTWVYRSFRWLVKSALVTGVASILPGSFVDSFALKNSEASRSYDRYRSVNHGLILKAAEQWLINHCIDTGIIGHFHVPYAETFDKRLLMAMDSWDKPSALVRRDGTFRRIYLDSDPKAIPLRSVLNNPTILAEQS